ncbi:Uncharacterised protein [uncultured archaeon]|nr:Uncharacterised protein [uncultured archaeon]
MNSPSYGKIVDPITGKKVEVTRNENWKIAFGAASKYCGGLHQGRIEFTQCVNQTSVGAYRDTIRTQQLVDLAQFPVEDFIQTSRLKNGAFALALGEKDTRSKQQIVKDDYMLVIAKKSHHDTSGTLCIKRKPGRLGLGKLKFKELGKGEVNIVTSEGEDVLCAMDI